MLLQNKKTVTEISNGQFFSLLFISLTSAIFIFSVGAYFYFISLDMNVLRAEPYIQEIIFKDANLKELALSYTIDCEDSDTSCKVNKIYRAVISNNKYISDPNEIELIRSPQDTLTNKGGDCEDLAILASSLLENLNISTYLVLTQNHVYALACGIEMNKITSYGRDSLKEVYAQKIEDETNLEVFVKNGQIFVISSMSETIALSSGYLVFRSLGGKFEVMDIEYQISSEEDFDFYVVPSEEDFRNFEQRKKFDYYQICDLDEGVCRNVASSAGVLLYNPNFFDIKININLKFIYPYDSSRFFVNQSHSFYRVKDETCVVLETTAGEYGFVGLASEDLVGEKLAFDPKTKEYFILS